MFGSLTDRNIIITGASSGIGRQCCITCSRMGAVVALIGRDRQRLDITHDLMANPERHMVLEADITDYEKVEKIVCEFAKTNGKISGLVNCAGISTTLPVNMVSVQKMDQFLRTNVIGAVNLSKQVVKPVNFAGDGGSIIFISSVMGVVGEKGKTLYSTTKGALISAARSMAAELAQRNIRVNAISPGVVDTPMSANAVYTRNEESLKRIKAMHPLGLGQPEDVANACVFLLSDASRWITGINLIVDGGYTAI